MWTKVGRPVLAGTPVTYTVSLTNNDGSNCGALTFNLPLSMPYGWTATIGSSALTLSPGRNWLNLSNGYVSGLHAKRDRTHRSARDQQR